MKRIFYILLFIISALFYWCTALHIENRAEAEDAYEYAVMVESEGHPLLYHPHHLLYGPIMKKGYSALQSMGYEGRAFGYLTLVSALSAAGSLFFFFQFCYRRFSLRPVSSLMATGMLAASYGFWRYAAEAEIVLPASFVVLAALYFATDSQASRIRFAMAVLLSAFAVLLHVMNAVAVFFAIPCFYLLRRRWKTALVHVVLVTAIVALLYGVAVVSQSLDIDGMPIERPGLGSILKGSIALCQCVISGDFVMGFRSVRAFMSELFYTRMLDEEFYLGARLSRPFVLFSLLTYIGFGALCVACLSRAAWVWNYMAHHRERFQLPEGITTLAIAVIWFVGYAGLLLLIEPGNPELWVMGLVPLWLLFCGLILLPLTVDNRLWLPFAMVVTLFVHNGLGGIGVLGDPGKDYQYQKARWLLEHASPDDVVITAGDPAFERYFRYHFAGRTVYLHAMGEQVLKSGELPACDGTIYLMGDVFNQIHSLRARFPRQTERIDTYADQLRTRVEKIVENEFGGVYSVIETEEDGGEKLNKLCVPK